VNKAVVNEDPNSKLVRELKLEIAELRKKLAIVQEAELEFQGGVESPTLQGQFGEPVQISGDMRDISQGQGGEETRNRDGQDGGSVHPLAEIKKVQTLNEAPEDQRNSISPPKISSQVSSHELKHSASLEIVAQLKDRLTSSEKLMHELNGTRTLRPILN
jgi:hypothetical protein